MNAVSKPAGAQGGTSLPGAYWRLWTASSTSALGDGAFSAAAPVIAALHGSSALAVSLIAAASYLPWLLFSVAAGNALDRSDRLRIFVRAQYVQFAAAAIFAASLLFTSPSAIALGAVAFVIGTAEVFAGNASQVILPSIVQDGSLGRANGYLASGATVTRSFLGPPIGSVTAALYAAFPIVLNAVSFLVSALIVKGLRTNITPTRPSEEKKQMRSALRWLRSQSFLLTLLMLLAVNNFCNQVGSAVLVVLVTRTMQLPAVTYGLLITSMAIGGFAGGLLAHQIVGRIGERATLIVSLSVTGVAFVCTAVGGVVTFGALLLFVGLSSAVWNVVTLTARQRLVPAGMLGRVNSLYRMAGWGLIPVGAVVGGVIAQAWTPAAAFPLAGALRLATLIAALPILLSSATIGRKMPS